MLMKMPILNYVISLGLIFTIFSISKMINLDKKSKKEKYDEGI